jgi:hypothetical protein
MSCYLLFLQTRVVTVLWCQNCCQVARGIRASREGRLPLVHSDLDIKVTPPTVTFLIPLSSFNMTTVISWQHQGVFFFTAQFNLPHPKYTHSRPWAFLVIVGSGEWGGQGNVFTLLCCMQRHESPFYNLWLLARETEGFALGVKTAPTFAGLKGTERKIWVKCR